MSMHPESLRQMSYARGEGEPDLLEETIGANFARTARRFADREALVEVATGRRWTWAALTRDVDRLARGLIAAGISKGDRVGIWSPNCAEWTMVQYATAQVGAILVNVNPAYRTYELAYVINQSGMRLLLSATTFKTSDYAGMVAEVRGECPALERVAFIGTDDWVSLVADGDALSEDALIERRATLDPGDPINIQYTSGTTGQPKGATLTHRNILNNGYLVTELINLTEDDRLCIPVPSTIASAW
jgi:fatty-acyl-CoA synthase